MTVPLKKKDFTLNRNKTGYHYYQDIIIIGVLLLYYYTLLQYFDILFKFIILQSILSYLIPELLTCFTSHYSTCGCQMEQKCKVTPNKNADMEYKYH